MSRVQKFLFNTITDFLSDKIKGIIVSEIVITIVNKWDSAQLILAYYYIDELAQWCWYINTAIAGISLVMWIVRRAYIYFTKFIP
jgi:hypothetical protein